ncbi:MAG: hypothetical protein KAK00_09405 [Nanoarchaeota archaeon]|nr:hypothetical protein [Nanoarchaeota archaeon]
MRNQVYYCSFKDDTIISKEQGNHFIAAIYRISLLCTRIKKNDPICRNFTLQKNVFRITKQGYALTLDSRLKIGLSGQNNPGYLFHIITRNKKILFLEKSRIYCMRQLGKFYKRVVLPIGDLMDSLCFGMALKVLPPMCSDFSKRGQL